MKYSIAVQFTIIAWFSTCVFAQQYNPPAPKVIQDKLNISPAEFIKGCKAQKGLGAELVEFNSIDTKVANVLSDALVQEAKKSPKIDEKGWDKLIQDKCLADLILGVVNGVIVDQINDCFVGPKKINGAKKTDFANALLSAYCAEVKRLAKAKYGTKKN